MLVEQVNWLPLSSNTQIHTDVGRTGEQTAITYIVVIIVLSKEVEGFDCHHLQSTAVHTQNAIGCKKYQRKVFIKFVCTLYFYPFWAFLPFLLMFSVLLKTIVYCRNIQIRITIQRYTQIAMHWSLSLCVRNLDIW